MLDQIVADLLAGRGVTDDELFASQVLPFQLLVPTEMMSIRQHDKHALGPELFGLAFRPIDGSGDERQVEPKLSNGRDMFGRIAVDQFDMDPGMFFRESIQKFTQKAGGDRGENAGPDPSFSPVRDDGGISSALLNVTKRAFRPRQKTLAGVGELNAPTASLENGDAEMALEIANAAADRRFLNAKCNAGLAEAAMLDRRHEIAQMP